MRTNVRAVDADMGRPTDYCLEITERICARMCDGESLRQICKDPAMPGRTTVHNWLLKYPEFREQFEFARSMLYENWAEEINEIGDDSSNDYIKREVASGRVEILCDHENVNRSRLRCDNRKWLLSKLMPKQFGDKVTVDGAVNHYNAQPVPVEQRETDPMASAAGTPARSH